MIFKYFISIYGDTFYPENIFNKIKGNFIIASFFNPQDKKSIDNSKEYGFGSLSFWHPKKFSTEENIVQYENDFVEFIEKNNTLFVENGVSEFEIYMEIYYNGGQCNFEIFNKETLKKISDIGISLPISIYVLSDIEILKWENNIRLEWKDHKTKAN